MDNYRFMMIDRLLKIGNGQYHLYFFKNEKMNTKRKRHELQCLSRLKGISRISVIVYNTENLNYLAVTNYKLNDRLKRHIAKIYSFKEYQDVFIKENNHSKVGKSTKIFGDKKSGNTDKFVTNLLKNMSKDDTFLMDNEGIDITEKLLKTTPTTAFDIDLYDSKNNVIYEFLKTENPYISNATAHPMRYSWTGQKEDNSQKFISLNQFAKQIGACLKFVIYSTRKKDCSYVKLISDAIIKDQNGFSKDKEYIISSDELGNFLEYNFHQQENYLIKDNDQVYLVDTDFKNKENMKEKLKGLEKDAEKDYQID